MKIVISALVVLAFGLAYLEAPATGNDSNKSSAFDVSDQINKTLTLAPETSVRVSSFNGSLRVETWESDKAEINIQIKASDREAIDHRPVIIDHSGNTLIIRTENDREGKKWGWDRGWVRHDVRLRLPRNISLKVASINGSVNVGQVAGEVGVTSVNGRVEISQAGSLTELSSINGRTTVSTAQIGERGLRISSINGGVEIGLPAETRADVEVRSVNGGIDTDLPIAVIGEMRRGQLVGKLGGGGAPIRITSVNGGVTLRRN